MNAEQKKMYFTETALALNREGFHAEKILGGTLGVWLNDEPLCEVSEIGGITYRGENISTKEREAAKDKALAMSAWILAKTETSSVIPGGREVQRN